MNELLTNEKRGGVNIYIIGIYQEKFLLKCIWNVN